MPMTATEAGNSAMRDLTSAANAAGPPRRIRMAPHPLEFEMYYSL